MKSTSDSRRLAAACCGLMFVYGCFLGASQAVIGAVAGDLGLDIAGMGILVSLQHVPGAFVPVLMGSLADRIGRKPVISFFCALFGIGLAVCGAARSTAVYALGVFAVGAGYSVCESGCCAVMSDMGADWAARGINLSQALLCLGAVLSPVVIGVFGIRWRAAYWMCAGCCGVMLPILLSLRFPAPAASERPGHGGLRTLLASFAFLCMFAAILLYVGMESGFGYFIESLFSSRFARTPISCVSLYWLGMMLSRFVFSSIRYRAKPVLIGCFGACAVLFAAQVLSPVAGLSLALCFATGFAYGPIWSTLVAEATSRNPENAGLVAGLMSAGCGAGGILFPAITGLVARSFSLAAAFGMMGAVAVLDAMLCGLVPARSE